MIIVDSDEWRASAVSNELIKPEFTKTPLIKLKIEDMQNPDYLIANKVGVERATIDDLVGKIKARSYKGQLQRVIDKGYQPAALIEGLIPSHSDMRLEAVYGYISSLSESGLIVIHTLHANHTAHRLVNLHDKIVKGEYKELQVPVVRSHTNHPVLSKLIGIKNVDETTAEKIRLKYKNILSFTWDCYRQLKYGKSKLMEIKGIGKKIADKIAGDWTRRW